MKRLKFFLTVILPVFFLATAPRPSFCAAAERGGVIAEGMAIKTEEKADYKKRALQDAHKKAVAETMEKMLSDSAPVARQGGAVAVESRILNDAGSYILTYKVLSEGWLTHSDIEMPAPVAGDKLPAPQAGVGVEVYHVRIEAGVDLSRLKLDMERISDAAAPATPPEAITVTLVDVPDYKTYSELMAAIERVGLIKDPAVSSLYRGRITLVATAKGGEGAIIERLAKELSEGYAVMPATGGGIIVKVTKRGGAR